MDLSIDDSDMARVALGCRESFERLVDRYRPELVGWLRKKVGLDDAEDIAQETFLSVFRNAGSYSAKRSFRGWVYAIARNLVIDSKRSVYSRRVVVAAVVGHSTLDELIGGADPAVIVEHRDMLRVVRDVLTRVPNNQSEALWEYAAGSSCAEMAAERGELKSTIKSRMRLARRQMVDGLAGRAIKAYVRQCVEA